MNVTKYRDFNRDQLDEVILDLFFTIHALELDFNLKDLDIKVECSIVISALYYTYFEDAVPVLEYAKRYIEHRLVGLDCVDETL